MMNKLLMLAVCASLIHTEYVPPEKPPLIEYKTLQNTYTTEELDLIYRVVETETYTADVESKSHVASVVFNMLNDPEQRFGKSVKSVIKARGRFAYVRKRISPSTKEAVHKAFLKNTAPDCYAFHSGRRTSSFAGYVYSFTDKVGHHFYED